MMNIGGTVVRVAAVAVLALAVLPVHARAARSASDMTGPWQLFVDDYLIASKPGVTRKYHAFQKYEGNPIIKPDMPWEYQTVKCMAVLPEESGKGFTLALAAMLTEQHPSRLFSDAEGLRPVNCSELVFDCDPRGECGFGLRLICKGIAEAWLRGAAPVTLARDLLIGEDAELGSDEQLTGNVDDVLVLGRVLGAEEIRTLSEKGARVLFGLPESAPAAPTGG